MAIKKIGFTEDMENKDTGGPRYMREIGTPKIGLHITNSNIKKTKDYCKSEDRLQKRGHFWIAYTQNCR